VFFPDAHYCSGSDPEAVDRASEDEMFLDDFLDVVVVDVGVPDSFGVHDENRSFITAVHAASLIDAHFPFALEFERGYAILGVGLCSGGAKRIAAAFSFFPLVAAKENVMRVMTHRFVPPEMQLSSGVGVHPGLTTNPPVDSAECFMSAGQA
jgi:hypothetical protein